MSIKQRFIRGDKVKVIENLGSYMRHFRNNYTAIVMYSYADQYGEDDIKSYALLACDTGQVSSWYEEHQLIFLEHIDEYEIRRIEYGEDPEKRKIKMMPIPLSEVY